MNKALILDPDIALVKNNASVGSDIAIELSKMQQGTNGGKPGTRKHDGIAKVSVINKEEKSMNVQSKVVRLKTKCVCLFTRLCLNYCP